MVVSPADATDVDVKDRRILLTITAIKTTRSCTNCTQKCDKWKSKHLSKGGSIIYADTVEFNGFRDEYEEICDKINVFDDFGDESDLFNGKSSRSFDVVKLFEIKKKSVMIEDQKVDKIVKDQKDDKKTEPEYETRVGWTPDEFDIFMGWLEDKKVDNVYKMKVLFEENDLPSFMKNAGQPYRPPKSYSDLYVISETKMQIFFFV